MNVQDQLREFIVAQFMYEQNNKALELDDDLLNQGIVDSMGILQVVNFMEEKFGVRISDEEITPENFRSLRVLSELVAQKSGAPAVA
jgi:acyl carrier protein